MKLPFLFGLHNHQPLGNFSYVIEQLTKDCYFPFLSQAKDYPSFKFSLHVSGILLKWWEANFPPIIDLIGKLVEKKRLELVCGGFYEPILATIPKEDRKEQVLRHKDYIKKLFGAVPVGLWLTERVWEQCLVEDLADLGIRYVVVDDRHFLVSGFESSQLHGYYLTESQGRKLAVFPIDENLRYAIPFWPIDRIEKYLQDIAIRGGKMAIYFDDGEKFGAWPGTKKWVYEQGWLEKFLKSLEEWQEKEIVISMTYEEVLSKVPAQGLAYLPVASYMEMEEWSLPASRILELKDLHKKLDTEKSRFKPFIRGGHWKNFFIKYPESNYLHKRMLQVSALSRKKFPLDKKARLSILASQCNDAYWHGIFGGLYLPHLRHANWQALLQAEARLRNKQRSRIEKLDIDLDGQEEILYHSSQVVLVFKPSYGAHLIELSSLASAHNFQNNLTRRFEAYHLPIKQLAGCGKEVLPQENSDNVFSIHDLEKCPSPEVLESLVYDWYERHSLIEHFFDPQRTLEDFTKCDFGEWGDFANQPFEFHRTKNTLLFFRDGGLYPPRCQRCPLLMRKKVKISKKGFDITINYELEYKGEAHIACNFGVEFNIFPPFMAHGEGKLLLDGLTLDITHPQEVEGHNLEIRDDRKGEKFIITSPEKSRFYLFPVKTVSQSEKGYDLTTQCLAIMPFWFIEFSKGIFYKELRLQVKT